MFIHHGLVDRLFKWPPCKKSYEKMNTDKREVEIMTIPGLEHTIGENGLIYFK